MLGWLMEELDRGIVAGSLRFSESSGKTSHNFSLSRSLLAMCSCTWAWKEKVAKVVEAFTNQHVEKSVEEVKT